MEFDISQISHEIELGYFKDSILLACIYHQMAVEYFYEFNNELESLKYNEKAEEIRSKIKDGLLWRTKLNIGYNYYNLNEYKKAITYFQEALLATGKKEANDLIDLFRILSECYLEKGDFEIALDYANKSITTKPKQPNWHFNLALNTYSSILINSKETSNFKKAINFADEALQYSQLIKDDENIEKALNNLAMAYVYLGNFDKAMAYYQYAIELPSKNDTTNKAILLNNIANLYYDQEKPELGLNTLNESLRLLFKYYETDFNYDYAAPYENLADNYTALQQLDTALIHYQKALINLTNNFRDEDVFQNPNPKNTSLFVYSNPDMIQVLHLKATASYQYYQQNKNIQYLKLAKQTYQTAFDFHDQLQQNISTENSRLFQAKNILPYIENALNVAFELQEKGKDISESAFRFMEKNKATVLLQSMNEADALQFANLPDTLLEQEKDLKIAITYHNKQLNEALSELSPSGGGSKGGGKDGSKGGTEIQRLNNILFEEKQQYSRLINQLENNYPNYYRLKYQQNQTQLKNVQKSLDDKTALLEYFVGDSIIYILSIQKNHSKLYQIKKPASWKQTISDFRQSITDINNDLPELFAESAFKLYQLLLNEPLCDISDDITHLQIIPDAELNYIPFEILLTESTDISDIKYKKLPYLLKQKYMGYAYSAALLLENKKSLGSSKTWSYGGYAPIYEEDNFNDLPIARETVKALANSLNGKAFINEQANLADFINNTNSYKILHLAMHGFLNDKNPLSSYLAFTKSERHKLHAYDLYNQKLDTELAILHACNTGSGELQKGEGVMSLSRAFTYAGCPSLVMSLWSIPEEATSDITISFIKHLKNGLPKDIALQKAKLAYLQKVPERNASPAYWAGLVATGNLNAINLD